MRLRWTPKFAQQTYRMRLLDATGMDLLTVVDAVLQLHPGWDWMPEARVWGEKQTQEAFVILLADLQGILIDGGSQYRADSARCLVRRVDATVQDAADKTISGLPVKPADHLKAAWVAAYGIEPDPDRAYDEAILAIEEIACPLVSPTNSRATLGTVIAQLEGQTGKWELAVGDSTGQPASIDRFVGMLKLLWQGQSRHGGAANSRKQTQDEAEAVVHMAITLAHWLTSGVLRRKP
jgi:hypothetical protein